MNTKKVVFYIARHGTTILNTLNKVQGWCDSPLTKEGREVAGQLGRGLRELSFDAVYVSDLQRTKETAKQVLKFQGQQDLKIIKKEELKEVCFGSYEGAPVDVLWREVGLYLNYTSEKKMLKDVFDPTVNLTQVDILRAMKTLDTLGMAEDFEEVEKRTQKALREIAESEARQDRDSTVFIVSHGMAIVIMLMRLGGNKLLKTPLLNASVCKVVYENGDFIVESMGDLTYIEKGMMR